MREICGVKSSGRARRAKGYSTKEEEEEEKFFTQLIVRGLCTVIRSCLYMLLPQCELKLFIFVMCEKPFWA
jgi:hypothetical protein